jgi:hypothetical protein
MEFKLADLMLTAALVGLLFGLPGLAMRLARRQRR